MRGSRRRSQVCRVYLSAFFIDNMTHTLALLEFMHKFEEKYSSFSLILSVSIFMARRLTKVFVCALSVPSNGTSNNNKTHSLTIAHNYHNANLYHRANNSLFSRNHFIVCLVLLYVVEISFKLICVHILQ